MPITMELIKDYYFPSISIVMNLKLHTLKSSTNVSSFYILRVYKLKDFEKFNSPLEYGYAFSGIRSKGPN